jgi:type II secretory pathway component GspD/PulD (secretin)
MSRGGQGLVAWAALAGLGLCGCAGAPEREPREEPVVIAQVEDPPGTNTRPDPPTDFLDFPSAPDLLPRDYEMEEEAGTPLAGYVTRFYRVRSQTGAELIAILNHWKSAQARIVNVPQHNMLIITEQRERLPVLERVLQQVDLVPPQVEIEARVVEILETDGFEYGFELHTDRAPAGDTALRRYDGVFNSNSFLSSLTNQAAPFQGASMNWASVGSVVEELGDFEFIMRALETEGYAEIVSAPRVVCRSGNRAVLRTATKLPIQDFVVQSTNNVRIGTRFEAVGVTLEVSPTVVGRDAITVEVKPSVSNVVRFEFDPSAGGIPIPVIAERSAITQVDIRNGELLVIGGLLDTQSRSDRRGVPILSHIPLLGRFFASNNELEQKTNVVFILRIRILTSAEKARNRDEIPLTREERTRLEETNEEDPDDEGR